MLPVSSVNDNNQSWNVGNSKKSTKPLLPILGKKDKSYIIGSSVIRATSPTHLRWNNAHYCTRICRSRLFWFTIVILFISLVFISNELRLKELRQREIEKITLRVRKEEKNLQIKVQ